VAVDRQDAPCLEDAHIVELAALAKRIERHRGAPQDIEWAVAESGELRVLQVRPETVWSQRKPEGPILAKKSALEHVLTRFAAGPLGAADKSR
jgi:pyruvate,water dikinase